VARPAGVAGFVELIFSYKILILLIKRPKTMTLTHIDIDIADEQEAVRVLSLLTREHIPHRIEQRPLPLVTDMDGMGHKTLMARQVDMSDKEWDKTYQLIMQGGSQQLDVEAMIAEIKEDRPMPFRDSE
jgi:hypothetical protein